MQLIGYDRFMKLPTQKIAKTVHEMGKPRVGVLSSNGNRRVAVLFHGLDPTSPDFMREEAARLNGRFMEEIEIMMSHGLHTLFVPALTHGNLQRKKEIDAYMRHYFDHLYGSQEWRDFYRRMGIRVRFYGNLELLGSLGYSNIVELCRELEEETADNKRHRLFYGMACSSSVEHLRLMDLAIEFYIENGRKPTDKEKIRMYYGEDVEDVDFYLTAAKIRDSDIQPPLISGRKTQLYFLVAPDSISLTQEVYRRILYDLIYCRDITMGKNVYSEGDFDKDVQGELKQYYVSNRSAIIGLGRNIGNIWVPHVNIVMPKSLRCARITGKNGE